MNPIKRTRRRPVQGASSQIPARPGRARAGGAGVCSGLGRTKEIGGLLACAVAWVALMATGACNAPTSASATESPQALEPQEWSNELGIDFVRIPAGRFQMGSDGWWWDSARTDERPAHEVTISRPFYLGKHEVTQGQWKAVMGSNPSKQKMCGEDCPVDNVSWNDTQRFIRILNEQARGQGYHYRLPTESEWEYAARGGTVEDTPKGNLKILGMNNAPVLNDIAWYGGNSGFGIWMRFDCSDWPEKQYPSRWCGPNPIGRKWANPWGLHDMLGNVWEWVWDWYGDYPGEPVRDPRGPGTGWERVIRGGSWRSGALQARSPYRGKERPYLAFGSLGFRLLREIE